MYNKPASITPDLVSYDGDQIRHMGYAFTGANEVTIAVEVIPHSATYDEPWTFVRSMTVEKFRAYRKDFTELPRRSPRREPIAIPA